MKITEVEVAGSIMYAVIDDELAESKHRWLFETPEDAERMIRVLHSKYGSNKSGKM